MKNFKMLLVFISALLFIGFAFAQAPKFTIAVENAYNNSILSSNFIEPPGFHRNSGFSTTFFWNYNFKKIWSIKSGLAFEKKGINKPAYANCPDCDPVNSDPDFFQNSYTLDYLTMPLMVEAAFGKKIKYFFDAGIYSSVNLNKTSFIKVDNLGYKYTEVPQFHNYDAGISWGIGVKIQVGKNFAIPIEIRGIRSLVNISSTLNYKTPDYFHVSRINTRNISVGLSYSFGNREVK